MKAGPLTSAKIRDQMSLILLELKEIRELLDPKLQEKKAAKAKKDKEKADKEYK